MLSAEAGDPDTPGAGPQPAPADDSLAPEELRRSALRGLRATVVARPASELILLGAMVTLARLVSPADYGRFSIALLVSGLGQIPLGGVAVALIQRKTVTREHLQAALAIALAMTAVLVGLILLASRTVVTPVFGSRTAAFVDLSTLGIVVSAFNVVPAAMLQRRLAISRLAILDVLNAAVGAAASIALALAGLGGFALVLGGLCAILLQTIVNWAWAPQPMPRLRRDAAREIARVGLPQSAAAVSWLGFGNIDYAIVAGRLGVRQNGFYSRAYTIGVIYQTKVSQVLNSVGFPILSRTQTDRDRQELRRHMVHLMTVLLFPMLLLLTVLAPELLPWALGRKWTPAVLPTQILTAGGAAALTIDAVGAVLMASGRTRALLGFGWGHFVTYGVVVWVGASFGITGVAVAAGGDHIAFLLVAYAMLFRPTHEPVLVNLWRDLRPALVGCAGLAAVAVPLNLGLSAAHAPVLAHLIAVPPVGAGACAACVRLACPDAWRTITGFLAGVLPLGAIGRRLRPRGTATATIEHAAS